MLEFFIFIFDGAFQPVIAVQVHDDAALVKAVMAFRKLRLYKKGEVLFFS